MNRNFGRKSSWIYCIKLFLWYKISRFTIDKFAKLMNCLPHVSNYKIICKETALE